MTFSKKQLLALTWWNRPRLREYDAIICDGAVRSGKTRSMVGGFFLWSMASFDRTSLPKNIKEGDILEAYIVEEYKD